MTEIPRIQTEVVEPTSPEAKLGLSGLLAAIVKRPEEVEKLLARSRQFDVDAHYGPIVSRLGLKLSIPEMARQESPSELH